jgi:prepilin-type processing-associated H-X9-DG protein
VIGIIALLISMLLPALNKARSAAQAVACQSNLRQVGIAVIMYANGEKGWLPASEALMDPGTGVRIYRGGRGYVAQLMAGGYISSKSARALYYSTLSGTEFLNNIELPDVNFLSCPTLPPPQQGYVGSFSQALTGASHATVYGLRTYPHDLPGDDWRRIDGKAWQSSAIDGSNRDFYGVTAKITRVSKHAPFLGDSIRPNASTALRGAQTDGLFFRSFPNAVDVSGDNTYAHRRHSNRANMWFVDGHVEAMDKGQIIAATATPVGRSLPHGFSWPK